MSRSTADDITLSELAEGDGLSLGSAVRLVWTERGGWSYVYDGPMSP